MHLLLATPGTIIEDGQAVDLGQTPAPIVILSAADSEIALVAAAHRRLRERHGAAMPELRVANLLALRHNAAIDLHVETVIRHARIVIIRLLGGRSYWSYGVEQIVATCREHDIALALLSGDDKVDADLAEHSSLPAEACARLLRCFSEGGIDNASNALAFAASQIGAPLMWREPVPLPRAGIYREIAQGRPRAGIVFYRALAQAGDLQPVDALVAALDRVGLDAQAIFVASLKDSSAAAFVWSCVAASPPDVIINLTGFAIGDGDPLAACDAPVLQAVLATSERESWATNSRGLAPRDIAMSVALPEIDGRVMTRAIAFKGLRERDDEVQASLRGMVAEPTRIAFVADLAAAWSRLRRRAPAKRRVALILANYPDRDGRIGNGVGLDTPASVMTVLATLAESGYRIDGAPADGAALMALLTAGPTNDDAHRRGGEKLALPDYLGFLATLPDDLRMAIAARWGEPERDPHFESDQLDGGCFRLPIHVFGNVIVAIQPARGYGIDPAATYHVPDLVPPHGYLAFYAWLREHWRADAIMHVGKHGNLEWLPGKAVALSPSCWPEAVLGPLPHLYPFIVNDPGEGTQAKRRAAAVILDHLTPPMTRAGSHGPGAALERLIDEYHEAAQQDVRRLKPLAREILSLAAASGIDRDAGIAPDLNVNDALGRLDGFLCTLKDLQIRDGLHIFGRAPEGEQRGGLLLAIARHPRGDCDAQHSLLRALAKDRGWDMDPLTIDPASPCDGFRIAGDAIDELERLALDLVMKRRMPEATWSRTRAVLRWIDEKLAPALDLSAAAECRALIAGLAGRRVAPGPSGAPTRGRPDVLPTGRNFFSVDTRAVPTPAAWSLGWASSLALLDRHRREHGEDLRTVAMTAWGTSNMRTGGDDIAQALALIGARPNWDPTSRRVIGFEILPVSLLDRPRVDVTLRISGMFRDAFGNLVELFDAAVRAVAALDESDEMNPIAMRVREDQARLLAEGASIAESRRRAAARVYGPMPGAYGAGLQALIDEGGWRTRDDFARAFVAWGGWSYAGAERDGEADHNNFARRLSRVEAVVQNQDNRAHDVLDSDDYYQFEGGLAASVEHLRGTSPAIYHVDTSLPERPRANTLAEEIARVVRGRATNPRWIAGCKRHGYKGAFEMAATVDYLFAFAATTDAVRDHHFDAVYEAYLGDGDTRAFIAEVNQAALQEIAERFLEAERRGLWHPRSNSALGELRTLATRGRSAS